MQCVYVCVYCAEQWYGSEGGWVHEADETVHTIMMMTQCNNPETKEPKLSAAKRILHEWTGLDEQARGLHDTQQAAEKHDEL